MRAQPLIVCRDVEASSRFYERLLGCQGSHGGPEYQRLCDPRLHHSQWGTDGLILQLHDFEVDHHHGPMGDPKLPLGNGVLLWFEIDDFDRAVTRARRLKVEVVKDVHFNPNAAHRELWLRDLDGYTVVLAAPDGEDPTQVSMTPVQRAARSQPRSTKNVTPQAARAKTRARGIKSRGTKPRGHKPRTPGS